MRVNTKQRSLDRAKRQGIDDPLQCIHCKSGYYMYIFPKNGGNFIACSWCFEQIESIDYDNLIMIREALRKKDE